MTRTDQAGAAPLSCLPYRVRMPFFAGAARWHVVYLSRSGCARGGMQDLRREVKDGARDPHLVHDQYEDYWTGVLNHARSIVAAEPGSLARAVNLCLAAHAERPRKVRWMRGRRMAAIVAGRPLQIGRAHV